MATTIVSTTRTTAVTLASFDTLLVSRAGTILASGNAVSGTGQGNSADVMIDGEVTALGSNTAVLLTMTTLDPETSAPNGNHTVSIGSTGLVRSEDFRGIVVGGDNSRVINAGEVRAESTGIELTGANGLVRNTGEVSAATGTAVFIRGANSKIENAGHLSGRTGMLSQGDSAHLANSGAILSDGNGISSLGSGAVIVNTGDILARDFGIQAQASATITNSGSMISARQSAILFDGGGSLLNSGLLQGAGTGVASLGATAVQMLNTGDILANGVAVSLRAGRIVNEGALSSAGEGVVGTAGGAITVQNGGSITAGTNGIHMNGVTTATIRNDSGIEAGDAGILIRNAAAAAQIAVRNTGEITADTGIEVESIRARVTNAGEIAAATAGIFVTGDNAVLRNSGTITADADFGIFLRGDTLLQVINTGTITADGGGIGVDQTSSKFAPAFVHNTGTIESGQVGVHSVGLDTGIILRNAGLIEGDFRGVAAQNGESDIVNIGTIAAGAESGTDRGAAVFLGTAADTLHNGGTILGRVDMGAGADRVSNAGWIDGEVRLGDGNDSYQAHRSGVAAHVLGGAGNDTLRGATGADRLSGEAGADVLAGGAGDDTLSGGLGRDILTGGAGADLFVFANRFESPSGAGRDAITDFTPGQDRIDVSAFMAGAVYLGSAAFSGTGRALRFDSASGLLEGDSNSDGIADWQVLLTTGLTLSVADFVL